MIEYKRHTKKKGEKEQNSDRIWEFTLSNMGYCVVLGGALDGIFLKIQVVSYLRHLDV